MTKSFTKDLRARKLSSSKAHEEHLWHDNIDLAAKSGDWFWTDQYFPEAKAVRGRIEAKLKSIGLNDPGLKDAYETWYALEW